MMYILGDNIISSLGFSTAENYEAVCFGRSGLRYYSDKFDLPEPFYSSLIDEDKLNDAFTALSSVSVEKYTRLEKMAILSAFSAISAAGIDAAAEDVLFIFSTTKGNIDLLDNLNNPFEKARVYLWRSAQLIAEYFGNKNEPIVVSNACISSCAAQIMAMNQINHHGYKYVVVVGAEVLSKFIVSGFQSFKALSPSLCMPFDKNRCGLNLGEAAATIVYAADNGCDLPEHAVSLKAGAMHNDSNHISAPSRTGEGLYRCIMQLRYEDIAFISAHGTATSYNDDMESVAINRAGLQDVPVTSLKGYFGHTLGAAGVLESIMSCHALQNNIVLKTAGTEIPGTINPVNVCLANAEISKHSFIKMMSGFGGCNAALLFTENNKI
ncbi:MAG: beta-ketoacyl synthase N-terminal-like domain-containing protein [Bacteroidales bacterium]|nr:beta-ketoacyl synthase N-terminal-like domain-containing protein [Bacteroidales bacterium]